MVSKIGSQGHSFGLNPKVKGHTLYTLYTGVVPNAKPLWSAGLRPSVGDTNKLNPDWEGSIQPENDGCPLPSLVFGATNEPILTSNPNFLLPPNKAAFRVSCDSVLWAKSTGECKLRVGLSSDCRGWTLLGFWEAAFKNPLGMYKTSVTPTRGMFLSASLKSNLTRLPSRNTPPQLKHQTTLFAKAPAEGSSAASPQLLPGP